MAAISQPLQEDHGYVNCADSRASLQRHARMLRPCEPEAAVRVHTAPGEEAQVGLNGGGRLYDPGSCCSHKACVSVVALCYRRHHYAELFFGLETAAWLDPHQPLYSVSRLCPVGFLEQPASHLLCGARRLDSVTDLALGPTRPTALSLPTLGRCLLGEGRQPSGGEPSSSML